MEIIRIGTRSSALALAQAEETRCRLATAHGRTVESFALVPMTTSGDRVLDRSLADVGGKGLFTREIEEALLDGRVDLAVHSSKDMPTLLPAGLEFATFLPREDPRDAFIGRAGGRLTDLPVGATVGSSSLRRQALIKRLRPDIRVVGLRGNVQTRLRKLAEGRVDGTLLAYAGLKRLGLQHVVSELLPLETFPPAPGQGAIGIERRTGDAKVEALLRPIGDPPTATAIVCERAFLAALDGSCRTPIAGYAKVEGDVLDFFGVIIEPDGRQAHTIRRTGSSADAAAIGGEAGAAIRADAGTAFFESWR